MGLAPVEWNVMARGWESKAVEDQIADAEASRRRVRGAELTAAERERHQQRMNLALSRARLLQDLESATDVRYRELLERSLADVDAALERLA